MCKAVLADGLTYQKQPEIHIEEERVPSLLATDSSSRGPGWDDIRGRGENR